jgi:hypothetical protein
VLFACTYCITFGPRAGQKLLAVQGAMPREPGFEQDLSADMQGVSLHAAVRCEADDRQLLERLCRYITRPALAYDRVQCNAAGVGRTEAEDAAARRHGAPGDVAAGVHAAAGRAGAAVRFAVAISSL